MKKIEDEEIFNKVLKDIKNIQSAMNKAEEAEVEQFYEDLEDLLEWTPQKYVHFIIGD